MKVSQSDSAPLLTCDLDLKHWSLLKRLPLYRRHRAVISSRDALGSFGGASHEGRIYFDSNLILQKLSGVTDVLIFGILLTLEGKETK